MASPFLEYFESEFKYCPVEAAVCLAYNLFKGIHICHFHLLSILTRWKKQAQSLLKVNLYFSLKKKKVLLVFSKLGG